MKILLLPSNDGTDYVKLLGIGPAIESLTEAELFTLAENTAEAVKDTNDDWDLDALVRAWVGVGFVNAIRLRGPIWD